jgi:hypothetical protein
LAEQDADLLLGAPKLRRFVWDFTTYYEGDREHWTDFNAREEEWMRCFARVALGRQQQEQYKLGEI